MSCNSSSENGRCLVIVTRSPPSLTTLARNRLLSQNTNPGLSGCENLTIDWLFSFNQYFLGSMKRLLILRDNEPPAKKTSTETEASDQGSDGAQNDTKLDLVYPFTDAPGGGSGGGGSTGQTISVTRPLLMTNNIISLQYANPFTIQNDALTLSVDASSLISRDVLSIRVATEGGITTTENGIGIIKNSGPIVIGSNGLNISTDTTLTTSKNVLCVKTSPTSPFITSNGLDLNYDYNSIQIVENKIMVKLDPSGPIIASSNGLHFKFNTKNFEVIENTLYLKNMPHYISPYVTYEVGNTGLSQYSGQVCSNQTGRNRIWNVAYYIFMVEMAGLVNGVVNIAFTDQTIAGSNSTATDGMNFSFVISPTGNDDPDTNLSQIGSPTITPSGRNNAFYPREYGDTYVALPPVSPDANWYRDPQTSGVIVTKFVPFGTVTVFGESTMGWSAASVQTVNTDYSRNVLGRVVIVTFNIKQKSNENWFQSPNGKKMTSGPLCFSYQATSQNSHETTTE